MRSVLAAVLDCCCVFVFVIIGRQTHHDADSLAGVWHTAWPFLAGLVVGLVVTRAWRRPMALVPAGLGAWLGAAAAGMVIRVLAGQGTAAAFIVVTLAFLGLFTLGWRLVARLVLEHLRPVRQKSTRQPRQPRRPRRPRHFSRTG